MSRQKNHQFNGVLEFLFLLIFTVLVSIGTFFYFNQCDIGINSNASAFAVLFVYTPIYFSLFTLTTMISLFVRYFYSVSTLIQWTISITSKSILAILIGLYLVNRFADYPMAVC
ncbi:hypothetical protein [Shimazuella kribbensis]|uniref:hypothetical protein n=1 Tax=Shimazuella kribbensis TaxID=139808 RepID=UPI00048ED027|nr:hypothetical protein [Shimazuella kribbensis]